MKEGVSHVKIYTITFAFAQQMGDKTQWFYYLYIFFQAQTQILSKQPVPLISSPSYNKNITYHI